MEKRTVTKKDATIQVKVTPEVFAKLKRVAHAEGRTLGGHLRWLAMKSPGVVPEPSENVRSLG